LELKSELSLAKKYNYDFNDSKELSHNPETIVLLLVVVLVVLLLLILCLWLL